MTDAQLIRPKAATPLTSYTSLLSSVRKAIHLGKKRAQEAVEREKVRTAWEVGKLILDHILFNKDRAGYGKKVIKRLSGDLSISNTELYYMVEFARTYPNFRTTGNLSWGHYQTLLRVNDANRRKRLSESAVSNDWNVKELRREIRKFKGIKKFQTVKTPASLQGVAGTYRITKNTAGELFVDLGFSNYLSVAALATGESLRAGDIVEYSREKLIKSNRGEEALYTYTAEIREILDGDTVKAEVALGFGFTTVQKLRLRGINAPELNRRDGERAKAFVEKSLSLHASRPAKKVLIRTHKFDKYDRYLVDVWIGDATLNDKLVGAGLATRIEE